MTTESAKPKITMKALAEEQVSLRTLFLRTMRSVFLVGLGVMVAIGVFFVTQIGERTRTCDSIEASFDSFLDVFIPGLTQRRPSLPPRPADEQAELDRLIASFRHDVSDALADCG